MADGDDIVDVKVEEADWEVLSELEEETRRTSRSNPRAKSSTWRKMRVNVESGQRHFLDISLIEEVKKHPVMYDTMHPHNRDTFLKEKTWREIGQAINVGPEYCKLRWKSIRDRFVKTEKQERAIRAKGLARISKPYRFAARLSFLRDYLRVKKGYLSRMQDMQNVSIDIDDDVNQDSPSDKDNADDSSVSDYGWAPTNVISGSSPTSHCAPASDKQLHVNAEPPHGSLNNGITNATMRQRLPEPPTEPQGVRYYDHPSPSGSRMPAKVANHSSSGQSLAIPPSHPAPTAEREPPEGDPGYDEVTYFLLSLAPALRRLSPERQSLAKIKMQTLLHEIEFNK